MAIESERSTDIGTSYTVEEDTLLLARLKESMRSPAISPLSIESSIFKVPQVLRRHNPEAYEPDVVSIGPFHRHHEQLWRMETVKQWYLHTLLTRMKKSVDEFLDILMHEKGVIEFEKRAREFYAERLDHLSQIEFIGIMILDGCFIIQLLQNVVDGQNDDPILKMDCMFQYVCHDLLLLENQLPWFVLRTLYSITWDSDSGSPSEFSEVLLHAFRRQNSLQKYFNYYFQHLIEIEEKVDETGQKVNEDQVLHILDLIRTFIVFEKEEKNIGPEIPKIQKIMKILKIQKIMKILKIQKIQKIPEIPEIPPATRLSEAGVKFNKGDRADNLLNIKFENGDLTIPELAVAELTEPLFRNLIAFEQCYHGRSHEITSYAFFMDKLISSDMDIKLLTEKKILANWLNYEDGSFLNSLYTDTTVKEFKYHKLCVQVNNYYEKKWNRHFEQFRRDNCSTPWKVIAFAVGILLLVVNLMQFLISLQSSTLFTGIRVNELSADI